MELRHRLQHSTGTGASDQDAYYHLMTDGLVIFRDVIFVSDHNKLKNLILREFHFKPYSGHLGYQNTLKIVNKFYYWLNFKRDVVDFVSKCMDFQQVKEKCKHTGGLLQAILIP